MIISRDLNNTIGKLRKYSELLSAAKWKTQLSALQSQMDPHFLFNTLNTISRMAMFEYAEQTVKLIEATLKILMNLIMF